MTDNQPEAAPQRLIVVGVDGSPNSLAALRRAVYHAHERDAAIELVYVIAADAGPEAELAGYAMLSMAVRCEAPDGPGVPFSTMVAFGDPAEVLVRLGARAHLLLIGARFHAGFGDLLGGDVVPYCLYRSSCPVEICADQRRMRVRPVPSPASVRHG